MSTAGLSLVCNAKVPLILQKLATKRLKTLHNSRNELRFVRFVGVLIPLVASVVSDAIYCALGK